MKSFWSIALHFTLTLLLYPTASHAKEVFLSCREMSGTEARKSDTIRDAASERVVKEEKTQAKNLLAIPVSLDLTKRTGYIRGNLASISIDPYKLSISKLDIDDTAPKIIRLSISRQDLTFTHLAISIKYEPVIGLLRNVYTVSRHTEGTCKIMPTASNRI